MTTSAIIPHISKKQLILTLLQRPDGASLDELKARTGWQPHSIRGALAHLKKQGNCLVTTNIAHGQRRYHLASAITGPDQPVKGVSRKPKGQKQEQQQNVPQIQDMQ
jgi:DeoR/GlpR family transcriptional regulator of sugar metabolism